MSGTTGDVPGIRPPPHEVNDVPTPARPPPAPILAPAPPVRPFRYPAWIVCSAALVLLATAYSASLLPTYLGAYALNRAARAAAGAGAEADALRLYDEVLALAPGIRGARLESAILLFRTGTEPARNEAMARLSGLRLEPQEWERLRAAMPAGFEQFFSRVPRRR